MFPAACFGPLSNFHSVLRRYAGFIVVPAGRVELSVDISWFRRRGCDKYAKMDQEESEWFNHVQSLDYMRLHVVFLQEVR